jgi:hypothetical protein
MYRSFFVTFVYCSKIIFSVGLNYIVDFIIFLLAFFREPYSKRSMINLAFPFSSFNSYFFVFFFVSIIFLFKVFLSVFISSAN